ncbi:hypothetical protein CJP74_02870 [Psittacicella melopsittaci]|uniref:Uncharacterized protein n=1 Tax=Psittacicella melopsittaci TaxID=2028576 RepID=A0A3A1Y639_9GAMM|nr:Bax inhibitor-1 family protein [Psittacicella melopsittaci]RIY33085.1 hypothetical protein CJP74_02870 [Psittacicella melopsittaci]
MSSIITKTGSYAYNDVRSVVLRKAFALLGVSVIAAIATGYFSLISGFINPTYSLVAFLLVFAGTFFIPSLGDTPAGYAAVVAVGALLGFAVIPTVAMYISYQGAGVVINALLSTAAIFITLATYAVVTKKDFTKIGGILFVIILSAVVVGLLNAFLIKSSFLGLALSYVVALVSCGLILYRLSVAINTGLLSVTQLALGLLIDVYNLFISLLNIFGNRNN